MDNSQPQVRWRVALEHPVGINPFYAWVDEKTELMMIKDQNRLRAFRSLCPHMGARLEWHPKKKKIVCPWHGLSFSAENQGSLKGDHPNYQKIQEYRAEQVNGFIEIYEN